MKAERLKSIFTLYKNAGIIDKAHIYIRLKRSYFDKIEKYIPRKGNILDFGCGHGFFSFYLSQNSDKRSITAVDVSKRKIDLAKKAAGKKNIKFIYKNDTINYLKSLTNYDAIAILNVLYLMSKNDQIKTIQNASNALKKNGVLVLVDHDADIKINTFYTRLRELFMLRILRLTSGDTLTFNPHYFWIDILKQNFNKVNFYKLDTSGFQKLYVCRK